MPAMLVCYPFAVLARSYKGLQPSATLNQYIAKCFAVEVSVGMRSSADARARCQKLSPLRLGVSPGDRIRAHLEHGLPLHAPARKGKA